MGPYKYGEKSTVRPSFCLFIDALGFSKEIIENDNGDDSKKANRHLKKFYKALDKALAHLNDETEELWGAKIFTDNIVLGSPLDTWSGGDEEGVFGSIINHLIWYQLTMVQHGFFIRGGWSRGNLYMDEKIVYGKALIEAYQLECDKAKYPRILLSENMKKMVYKHMGYYVYKNQSPQRYHLLKDENDDCFVNYLYGILDYAESYESVGYMLGEHKKYIKKKLKKFKNDSDVLPKYRWLAYYHDFFCRTFFENNTEEYLIDLGKEDSWEIKLL